jgi:hypothetical protein
MAKSSDTPKPPGASSWGERNKAALRALAPPPARSTASREELAARARPGFEQLVQRLRRLGAVQADILQATDRFSVVVDQIDALASFDAGPPFPVDWLPAVAEGKRSAGGRPVRWQPKRRAGRPSLQSKTLAVVEAVYRENPALRGKALAYAARLRADPEYDGRGAPPPGFGDTAIKQAWKQLKDAKVGRKGRK